MTLKQLLSGLILICLSLTSLSQSNVSINDIGIPPHPSAILDLSAPDRGFLMPRMPWWDRENIPIATKGLLVCDTTTNSIWMFTDFWWEELAMQRNVNFINEFGAIHNLGNLANDDFVFGSPQLDDDGNPSHQKRMFFDKGKAAFRAGEAWDFPTTGVDESKRWDSDSIGTHSIAMGRSPLAKGAYSIALGANAVARGNDAVAIGNTVTASGGGSVAIGATAWASGARSFSCGSTNESKGYASTTMGEHAYAHGKYSTAFGKIVNARAHSSVAMGFANVGRGDPLNWNSDDPIMEVGVGVGGLKNGLTIIKNGSLIAGSHDINDDPAMSYDNTRLYFYKPKAAFRAGGTIDDPVTGGIDEDAYWDVVNVGDYSAAFGLNTQADSYCSFAAGYLSTAFDTGATAFGASFANGYFATALGYVSHANGDYSLAAGSSEASGNYSTAMGSSTATETWSTAMGVSNATAFQATAMGISNATSTAATAMGVSTAAGSYSVALGHAHADAFGCVAVGYDNVGGGNPGSASAGDPVFEVGNGFWGSPSNAFTVLKDGRTGINRRYPQAMLDIEQPASGVGNGVRMRLAGAEHWETVVTFDKDYNWYYDDLLRAYLTETGTLHLPMDPDVGLATDGNLVIGQTSGWNISIDNNEIMARNANFAHDLLLQKDGGRVGIGCEPLSTLDVSGNFTVGVNYAGFQTAPPSGAIIQGSVGIGTHYPYSKVDISGNLAVGSAYAGSLPVAPTNGAIIEGKVGIGTNTPYNKLDVEGALAVGSTYSGLFYAPTNGAIIEGNVGIGTIGPANRLDVEGGMAIGSLYSGSWIAPANGLIIEGNVGIGTATPAAKFDVANGEVQLPASGGYKTHFNFGGRNFIRGETLFDTGDVGIGTTSPTHNLTIESADAETMRLIGPNLNGSGARLNFGDWDYVYIDEPTDDVMEIHATQVIISGTLTKPAGSFRIDHPLDPVNKYLSHSFVESPDMMNIYNGVVILDASGVGVVVLPDYFEALNRNFRYQLTPIGAPGPNLYIAQEIRNNAFVIAGGVPGMKVSWEVTGIRQDAYANKYRIPVEQDKPDHLKGKYLYPEVEGVSKDQGIYPGSKVGKN